MVLRPRPSERGVSLVALMVGITFMLIAMAIMMPTWSYVIQNEREEELLFRGEQIARAIEGYQAKNGNALPVSLDVLVKGRFLRRAYRDPMMPDGKWRFMHPGEPPIALEDLQATRGRQPAPAMTTIGPITGVSSRNPAKSLRMLNGGRRYSQWFFIAGQPRIVGKIQMRPGGPVGAPTPRR
jgi:type II secretory pathway pseudopilin PulG